MKYWSISSPRILYLNEFFRGLELFGIKETLLENKTLLRSLFINSFDTALNANYAFSLVKPTLSEEGSFLKSVEEKMLDHLQYFLMMMRNQTISGVKESLAYDTDNETSVKVSDDKINPADFLKWVTGETHKPLSIGNFKNICQIYPRLFDKDPMAQVMFSSCSCLCKGDKVTCKPHQRIWRI